MVKHHFRLTCNLVNKATWVQRVLAWLTRINNNQELCTWRLTKGFKVK
jgi:hypothetical protein